MSEWRCQGHNLRHCRTEAWAAADDGEGWGVDTTVRCRLHVLVMMTVMSAIDYWHCARRSKLPLSRAQRCKTKSGDLHPHKLMSISRSISSMQENSKFTRNKYLLPQKVGGQTHYVPPLQKVGGGTCPPVHPMIDAHGASKITWNSQYLTTIRTGMSPYWLSINKYTYIMLCKHCRPIVSAMVYRPILCNGLRSPITRQVSQLRL